MWLTKTTCIRRVWAIRPRVVKHALAGCLTTHGSMRGVVGLPLTVVKHAPAAGLATGSRRARWRVRFSNTGSSSIMGEGALRQGVVEHGSRRAMVTRCHQASRHGGFSVSRSSSIVVQGVKRLGVVQHVLCLRRVSPVCALSAQNLLKCALKYDSLEAFGGGIESQPR